MSVEEKCVKAIRELCIDEIDMAKRLKNYSGEEYHEATIEMADLVLSLIDTFGIEFPK